MGPISSFRRSKFYFYRIVDRFTHFLGDPLSFIILRKKIVAISTREIIFYPFLSAKGG